MGPSTDLPFLGAGRHAQSAGTDGPNDLEVDLRLRSLAALLYRHHVRLSCFGPTSRHRLTRRSSLVLSSFGLAAVPIKTYLQLSFRGLGFSTLMANLLTVPSTVISLFSLMAISILSEAVNNRSFVCMAENIWLFPCLVALVALPTIGPWQYFAVATVALSFPYVHAIQVGPDRANETVELLELTEPSLALRSPGARPCPAAYAHARSPRHSTT